MPIALKPEIEKRIQEKVSSGAYPSPDAVIQAGLSLLDQRDRALAELRADLQIGIDQLDRGEGLEADAVFAEFEAKFGSSTHQVDLKMSPSGVAIKQ